MSLVYQTLQFPCDREYNAEPLNYTGIRTIKLTNKPANVEVWISTDNTGQNLFPLKNRGDGWVNLDEPLQNCYIYTSGLNNTGEMLILNVTGQKDIFEYGTSSVERIGNVQELYMLQNLSPSAIAQIAKAIQGIYYKPPIHTIKIQGEADNMGPNESTMTCCCLPLGLNNGIASLNLDNDKFYKIEILGHFDIGRREEGNPEGGIVCFGAYSAHLCLFNSTNGATFTPITDKEFDNFYSVDKRVWANEQTDVFDFRGLKYISYRASSHGVAYVLENRGENLGNPYILKGNILNAYQNFGLFMNFYNYIMDPYHGGQCHSSLLFNIYEMETYDQLIGANK